MTKECPIPNVQPRRRPMALASFVIGAAFVIRAWKSVISTARAMDFPVALRSKHPPSAPEFRPQAGDSSRVRAKPPRHAGPDRVGRVAAWDREWKTDRRSSVVRKGKRAGRRG